MDDPQPARSGRTAHLREHGCVDGRTAAFGAVAAVLVVTSEPDFAVVVRNALRRRRQGLATGARDNQRAARARRRGRARSVVGACYVGAGVHGRQAGRCRLLVLTRCPCPAVGGLAQCRHEDPGGPAGDTAVSRAGPPPQPADQRPQPQGAADLPQRAAADIPRGAAVLPRTLLSLILVELATAWYLTLAGLVATIQPVLSRAAVQRRFDRVTGVVLVGLGVRLALKRRPVSA